MLSLTGMPSPGGNRHCGVPSPTSADPTARLSASEAGVGTNGVELDVHNPIPLTMRKMVSAPSSAVPVHSLSP